MNTYKENIMNTYHDVEIGCKNRIYKMMNVPFHMQLICERTAGWELWETACRHANLKSDERVGGEYADAPFEIRIKDAVICHNRFSVPVEKPKLSDEQSLTIGLLQLLTSWKGTVQELTVQFAHNQLSAYTDLTAYVQRFGGLWWAGYFWTASLEEGYGTMDKQYYARFVLSEPKSDGN